MELRVNNTLWNIAVALGALAIISTIAVLAVKDNTQYTLHSTTGCCDIHVEIQDSEEWDAIYTITYTDNLEGTSHTEVETREVDAEWMINTFQDHCYTHH